MNAFRLRNKIASAWSLDVIGMSLQECIDYVKECWLAMPTDCVVIWSMDESERIAEVSSNHEWIKYSWLDRMHDNSALEALERQHERY